MQAKEMVLEFFEINQKPTQQVIRPVPTYQHPPQEGMYKANFDAALFDGLGMASLGVIVKDYTGHIIVALSQKIRSPHSVEMAKALACNRALVFVQELSLSQVVFEGDSLQIVQAVNSQEACLTLCGHVIEEIQRLQRGLLFSCFQHVKRGGNKLAHSLTRRAVSFIDTDVWVEELPCDL